MPFSFHAVDHAVDRGLPDVPCPVARVPYLSIASTQLPVISILLLKSRKQKITLKRTSHISQFLCVYHISYTVKLNVLTVVPSAPRQCLPFYIPSEILREYRDNADYGTALVNLLKGGGQEA